MTNTERVKELLVQNEIHPERHRFFVAEIVAIVSRMENVLTEIRDSDSQDSFYLKQIARDALRGAVLGENRNESV